MTPFLDWNPSIYPTKNDPIQNLRQLCQPMLKKLAWILAFDPKNDPISRLESIDLSYQKRPHPKSASTMSTHVEKVGMDFGV